MLNTRTERKNKKIQSAHLQLSCVVKNESDYWVCFGKEHHNILPTLVPWFCENSYLRWHFNVDNFRRKVSWSILGGTWFDDWGRSLLRQDFVSMSWISLTLLSSFNLSMRVSRLEFLSSFIGGRWRRGGRIRHAIRQRWDGCGGVASKKMAMSFLMETY